MSRKLVATALVAALMSVALAPAGPDAPTTGFEDRGGSSWTTYQEELAYLQAVDAMTDRVEIDIIGSTIEGRPLHLVKLGDPAPVSAEEARERPTVLFVCTQHGNEPAGREACLEAIRDIALSDDPTIVRQLREQTILFIPTANPDGRARNIRGNAVGTDINRDHLALRTPEAQAIARVMLEWEPDASADLHEYGPSLPAVYDDEMLYLWPRNLNVDESVRSMAKLLAEEYVGEGVEAKGYTAGEYGRYYVADDYHLDQSAGGGDEGIARNLTGLRHTAGILLETAVSSWADRQVGNQAAVVDEARSNAALLNRRVDLHSEAIVETLRFMRDQGRTAAFASSDARVRKAEEGARQDTPVYFSGQDRNDYATAMAFDTEPESVDPMCGYLLDEDTHGNIALQLDLHGIQRGLTELGDFFVPMAQAAEPLIPLLLDGRGNRSITSAVIVHECAEPFELDDGAGEAKGDDEAEGSRSASLARFAHLTGLVA